MKCIVIFDNLNDIVYTKYNRKFAKHLNKFAVKQGLLPNEERQCESKLNSNIIMQIFSPIVTSQRIMCTQFGNSYTSCQCQDGLNVVFEQYMGHMFISIGQDEFVNIKKMLGVCIALIRHLCGADVSLLKSKKTVSALLTKLLDHWIWLYENDQSFLVEAVEQVLINAELGSITLKTLQEAIDKLRTLTEYSKMHAILFVQHKFLSLYSSRNTQDLSSADIMFLSLLSRCVQTESKSDLEDSEDSDEYFSPSSSPQNSPKHVSEPEANSFQLLLMGGNETSPKCLPYLIHVNTLTEGVQLVILIELSNSIVSSGLYESFLYLTIVQNVQMQRDIEILKPAVENLDIALKKTNDGLKKIKNNSIETCQKKLTSKWDFIKKKYQEFLKHGNTECLLRAESSVMSLFEILKELLTLTCFDTNVLMHSDLTKINQITKLVNSKLVNFSDFLKVKALRNLSLGSTSLTINKYLEEFPGLVHFLYIDRINHRVTAPTLDFNSEETVSLTKKKIWSMVKFSRKHLQEGHLSIMWKDTTFNYAYFLWFEDRTGSALKPKNHLTQLSKGVPQPGIFCGDFYQKLIEICFPKMAPNKVRCYELFCIHLGLVTSGCVLEHTRRIAATICEVIGIPNNPIDLL